MRTACVCAVHRCRTGLNRPRTLLAPAARDPRLRSHERSSRGCARTHQCAHAARRARRRSPFGKRDYLVPPKARPAAARSRAPRPRAHRRRPHSAVGGAPRATLGRRRRRHTPGTLSAQVRQTQALARRRPGTRPRTAGAFAKLLLTPRTRPHFAVGGAPRATLGRRRRRPTHVEALQRLPSDARVEALQRLPK